MEQEKQITIIIPEDLAVEFTDWARPKSFCNSGQHSVDRLADLIEEQIMPDCSYSYCLGNRRSKCVRRIKPSACKIYVISKV